MLHVLGTACWEHQHCLCWGKIRAGNLQTVLKFKVGRKRRFRFRWYFCKYLLFILKKAAFRLHNYILQLLGRNVGCALGRYFIL